MEDSNLFQILRTLNYDEMKDFGRFVDSPFHNRRKKVTEFFEWIKKYHPDFKNRNLTDEKLFGKLYPGKKYDDRVIRRISSFLMKVLESYLAYTRFKNDNYKFSKTLLEEIGSRNIPGIYERKLKSLMKDFSEFIPPSEEYFLKRYYIIEDKINNYIYKKRDTGLIKDLEDHSLNLVEFLLVLIFQNKYNLFLHEVEFQADFSKSVFNSLFEQIDPEKLLNLLKEKDSGNYPYVAIYYYELMSILDPDDESNISNFKKLLDEQINRFDWLEKRNFYYILVSACTLMIEKGAVKYKSELLEAYERMLELGIYSDFEGGNFSAKLFRNIVAAASLAEEYDWLERFINKYSNELSDSERKNVYNLSMALLNYARGEYGKTLENIMDIDIHLVQFKIDVRYLTVKTFYELNHYEQLLSSIDAFRHFLYSDKFISERVAYVYTNFCNLAGRLAKMKIDDNTDNLPLVIKEIQQLENKATSEWLMRKAKELDK